MKNKVIILISEAMAGILLLLFFFWRLYFQPILKTDGSERLMGTGMLWLAASCILLMVLIGLQAYFYLFRPYRNRIETLEKAAEESEQAEHIRREFVANVSHELKTPLTSISGFIETLQAGAAEDPEIRSRFIDIIAIETSRLKRLIEDLLVLSDIENKRESEDREFNVNEAIERTVEILKPIAEEKEICILQELDKDMHLSGSVDRFRQMMLNLIENAIKYSYKGQKIWVRALKKDGEREVSVRDEGIGIAPEHHQRLFERFYRVDKSRSKKVGGTGLGLSIVKHIAVLFGASLRVESQVGQGATFYVTFHSRK